MRRILLALALMPGVVFAQFTVPPNTTSDEQTLTEQQQPAQPQAPAPSLTVDPNGPVSADQIRAQQSPLDNRQYGPGEKQNPGDATTPDVSGTGTAAEQGFTADTSKADAQALADYQALHTARQLGEQVTQPAPFDPLDTNYSMKGWYANWSYTLVQVGVPASKVKFEAHRLDKEAFGAWANRQMMATDMLQQTTYP